MSARIGKTAGRLELLRRRARRLRVLWTLYAGFAYVIVLVVLLLVVGFRRWGVVDAAIALGGPIM